MQMNLREKGELLTFLNKEQPKFRKELDLPKAKNKKQLNLLSARRERGTKECY